MMPPKRQLVHLIEARALAKQRKLDARDSIVAVTFEDEATEGSWTPGIETSECRNLDWKEDSASEDDVEMTDDDEDVINANAFHRQVVDKLKW